MGKGIDLAREEAPEHAAALDDFKDQLIITLLSRLGSKVSIPVEEVDASGSYIVYMSIVAGVFNFDVQKKH